MEFICRRHLIMAFIGVLIIVIIPVLFWAKPAAASTPSPIFYVGTFGAKGDGVTDDTAAIQAAISKAPYGSGISFDGTKKYYVTGTIFLKSGITLIGNNTTIISPSTATLKTIFLGSGAGSSVKDITITGFNIQGAANNRIRSSGRTGLGSNLIGMHFSNATNIYIENINGKNLEFLIKTDKNNYDFKVYNITSSAVYTPIYMAQVTRMFGKLWNLDCPTNGSTLDHHVYFNEGMVDVSVEDVTCYNGTGNGAITISNSSASAMITRNVSFKKVRLNNIGGDGITVSDGNCYSVWFDDIIGIGNGTGRHWFVVGWGKPGKVIEGVAFYNFHFEKSGGALFQSAVTNGVYPKRVKMSHGQVQGKFGSRPAILPEGCYDLELYDITFTDATSTSAQPIIWVNTNGYGFTMKVAGCQFLFPYGVNAVPIGIRTPAAYTLTIDGNIFNNSGPTFTEGICNNYGGGTTIFHNNKVSGFSKIKASTDTKTLVQ